MTTEAAALEELIASAQPLLRLLCRSMLGGEDAVDDIVQETFARVCPRVDRLSGDRIAYLVAVARNLCRRELRRRGWRLRLEARLRANPEVRCDPEESAVDRVELLDVWDRLSAEDQRVLGACASGMRHRDIARWLGVTDEAAAQRVSRARRRARQLTAAIAS
jgi:RNA polymerase sigma factor (sigma-70 family)